MSVEAGAGPMEASNGTVVSLKEEASPVHKEPFQVVQARFLVSNFTLTDFVKSLCNGNQLSLFVP